jgi:MoxR-like ATPase
VNEAMREWIKTRPPEIQILALEFELGRQVTVLGYPKTWFIVGYADGDVLLISPVNPYVDYESSVALRQRVCAEHYR